MIQQREGLYGKKQLQWGSFQPRSKVKRLSYASAKEMKDSNNYSVSFIKKGHLQLFPTWAAQAQKSKMVPMTNTQYVLSSLKNKTSPYILALQKNQGANNYRWNQTLKQWTGNGIDQLKKKYQQQVRNRFTSANRHKQRVGMALTLQQVQAQVPTLIQQIVQANNNLGLSGFGPIKKKGAQLYVGRYYDPLKNKIQVLPKANKKFVNPTSLNQKVAYLQARLINHWNDYLKLSQQYLKLRQQQPGQYQSKQIAKIAKMKTNVQRPILFLNKIKNLIQRYLKGSASQNSYTTFILNTINTKNNTIFGNIITFMHRRVLQNELSPEDFQKTKQFLSSIQTFVQQALQQGHKRIDNLMGAAQGMQEQGTGQRQARQLQTMKQHRKLNAAGASLIWNNIKQKSGYIRKLFKVVAMPTNLENPKEIIKAQNTIKAFNQTLNNKTLGFFGRNQYDSQISVLQQNFTKRVRQTRNYFQSVANKEAAKYAQYYAQPKRVKLNPLKLQTDMAKYPTYVPKRQTPYLYTPSDNNFSYRQAIIRSAPPAVQAQRIVSVPSSVAGQRVQRKAMVVGKGSTMTSQPVPKPSNNMLTVSYNSQKAMKDAMQDYIRQGKKNNRPVSVASFFNQLSQKNKMNRLPPQNPKRQAPVVKREQVVQPIRKKRIKGQDIQFINLDSEQPIQRIRQQRPIINAPILPATTSAIINQQLIRQQGPQFQQLAPQIVPNTIRTDFSNNISYDQPVIPPTMIIPTNTLTPTNTFTNPIIEQMLTPLPVPTAQQLVVDTAPNTAQNVFSQNINNAAEDLLTNLRTRPPESQKIVNRMFNQPVQAQENRSRSQFKDTGFKQDPVSINTFMPPQRNQNPIVNKQLDNIGNLDNIVIVKQQLIDQINQNVASKLNKKAQKEQIVSSRGRNMSTVKQQSSKKKSIAKGIKRADTPKKGSIQKPKKSQKKKSQMSIKIQKQLVKQRQAKQERQMQIQQVAQQFNWVNFKKACMTEFREAWPRFIKGQIQLFSFKGIVQQKIKDISQKPYKDKVVGLTTWQENFSQYQMGNMFAFIDQDQEVRLKYVGDKRVMNVRLTKWYRSLGQGFNTSITQDFPLNTIQNIIRLLVYQNFLFMSASIITKIFVQAMRRLLFGRQWQTNLQVINVRSYFLPNSEKLLFDFRYKFLVIVAVCAEDHLRNYHDQLNAQLQNNGARSLGGTLTKLPKEMHNSNYSLKVEGYQIYYSQNARGSRLNRMLDLFDKIVQSFEQYLKEFDQGLQSTIRLFEETNGLQTTNTRAWAIDIMNQIELNPIRQPLQHNINQQAMDQQSEISI